MKTNFEFLIASLLEILQKSPDYVFIKDAGYVYRAASDAFAKMAGFPSAEAVVGKTDYDLFEKKLAEKYRGDDRKLLQDGRTISDMEEMLPSQDGMERWVRTSKYAIRDDDGTIVGMYGVGKDISELKRLQRDQSTLAKILGNVPGGVSVFSEQNGEIRLNYTNDSFYRTHCGSRTYWESKGANPLDWLVAEDCHLFEKEFRLVREGVKSEGRVTYRVAGEDGAIHWVSNQFRRAYEENGISYYYSSCTGIDDQKKVEAEADRNRRLFELAVIGNGIGAFEYNIRSHTITTLDPRTEEISRERGTGRVIHNAPESLLPAVMEESVPEVRRMYRLLDEGAPFASCDAWFKAADSQKRRCEHIRYTTVYDAAGTPLCAYGTAQDVTEQKLDVQKFERIYQNVLRTNPDALAVFRLNLTQNLCGDGYSQSKRVLELQSSGTADGFFEAAARFITDDEIRSAYRERAGRRQFLERFHNGQTQATFEYPTCSFDDRRVHWVSTFFTMARNPETGDVEAVTFSLDVSRRKTDEIIISRVTEEKYDHVGLVDLIDRTYELRSKTWGFGEHPDDSKQDYDALIARLSEHYVLPEDRDRFLHSTDLQTLTAAMRENGRYQFEFRCAGPNREVLHKRAEYSWLDNSKTKIISTQTDVTADYEREQAELWRKAEALRAEEQINSLRQIVSSIPAGLAVFQMAAGKMSILLANQYLLNLVKASRESVFERDFDMVIQTGVHPDDLNRAEAGMAELFSEKNHTEFTYRVKMEAADAYIWIRATGQAVENPDGTKTAYVLYQDATEQRAREAEYDRRISDLSAVNPNALWVTRLNLTRNELLRGQAASPCDRALTESKTVDEFFARYCSAPSDEEDRERFFKIANRDALLDGFHEGKGSLSLEYRRFDPARDELRWATSYFNLVRNPRTGDIEAVIYTQDTNEAVLFKKIMKHITTEDYDFLAVLDVQKRTVQFLNCRADSQFTTPTKCNQYDVDVQYAMHRLFDEEESKIHIAATTFDHVLSELEKEDSYVYSFVLRDENGQPLRKQLKYAYLDEMKDTILLTRTDLTAAYCQEIEQMRRMQEALQNAEQANRAKTDFVSRISHDIRTPIGIISNMTEFALSDMDQPEKLRDDLEKIGTSNKFLLSLVNDVLDISKIDSGKIELNPEPYSKEEYQKNIRHMLGPLCDQKKLRYEIIGDDNADTVLADKVRLNQITFNLLSNAVKYTPEGGKLTFSSFSRRRPDGMIDCGFTVSDTGIGMSEEFQKVMFEPFSQELDNPSRLKTQSGTGLGLSIVKRLVEQMGGEITVESALGKGSVFRVHLLFPPAPQSEAESSVHEDQSQGAELSGTVLLAEDNEINAEIIVRMLSSLGARAHWAENGKLAVERFSASMPGEYHAILMDLQMPVMNGYDAAMAIRAMDRPDAKTIPIIAMTADAFQDAMDRARASGMSGYVTKPLERERIRAVLLEGRPN